MGGMRRPDQARRGSGASTAIFTITSNNLNEGGRQRSGEAYLNVNLARFAFINCYEFFAVTDNGMRFLVRLSGSSGASSNQVPKNLRSVPSFLLGSWLVSHHRAQPGDEVHVTRQPGTGFLFTFVRRVARW